MRDLSSISKDFAAVFTDEVLVTDGRWSTCVVEGDGFDCSNGGVLSDLLVLLTHATAEEGRLSGRKEDEGRRGEILVFDVDGQISRSQKLAQSPGGGAPSTSSSSCSPWSTRAMAPFRRFGRQRDSSSGWPTARPTPRLVEGEGGVSSDDGVRAK